MPNTNDKPKPQTRSPFAIPTCLIATALYAVCFVMIVQSASPAPAPITAVLMQVAIGWFYGLRAGMVSALLSVPLNSLLLYLLTGQDWMETLLGGATVPGAITFLFVAGIVGALSDLSRRRRQELAERDRAEQELRSHRDRLAAQAAELQEINARLETESGERQKTNSEIATTKEQLERLIERSLDPIAFCDSELNITKANPAFLHLLDRPASAVLGQNITGFAVSAPGDYQSVSAEHIAIDQTFLLEQSRKQASLANARELLDWKTYYQNSGRQIVPISQNIVFLTNEQGERTAAVIIIRDLTEQRKRELELIAAKEAAEHADQAKSVFLASMSHEIRTPMNGIVGFTDMLLDAPLTPEQQDYAGTIKRSGEVLLGLINDILDFSKIDAGKLDFENIDFDIEMLAYDVLEMVRPEVDSNAVTLKCSIADGLPARLTGDPHRYRQMLLNILRNAAKFTEAGEIELSLSGEPEADGTILLYAAVRDTGIGIPPEKHEDIFDIFQQLDTTTTRKFGGAGLGLSICRKIAALMGGTIRVESEPDKGSTFHITTRMQQAADTEIRCTESVALSGRRVFIVDDNRPTLDAMKKFLLRQGVQVSGFTTTQAALQEVTEPRDTPFDAGIIDIKMSGDQGLTLVHEIRSRIGHHLPLLALTTPDKGDAKICEESGMNAYLPKPPDRDMLVNLLEVLLGTAGTLSAKFLTQYSLREEEKQTISILLAEDNPVNRKLAVSMLTKAGYRVETAENGRQALEMFSAAPDTYDVILMDIQMPVMDGLEATKAIRSFEKERRIPIISMTASNLQNDLDACCAAGMDDSIEKPIKREAVFATLHKWRLA